MSDKKPQKAFRFKHLPEFVGTSKSQIKQMIKAGVFPAGNKINPNSRTKIWFEDELIAWQQQRREAAAA